MKGEFRFFTVNFFLGLLSSTLMVERMKFLKPLSIILASLFAALALSGCANNDRLEAFVSSEDSSKLHVNIGGAAISDQVYMSFMTDRRELKTRFDIDMGVYVATADEFTKSRSNGADGITGFRELEDTTFSVSQSSVSSTSNGKRSFELRGTLTREDGSAWDLAPGDVVAVWVDVYRSVSRHVASDYVVVVVSETSAG